MRCFEEKDLVEVDCNLCGSSETKLVALRSDGLRVVECLNCGLAYLNPRPADDVISRLYDREYYGGADHLKSYSMPDYFENAQRSLEEKTHFGFKLIDTIAEYQPLKDSRLLDVGCAFGAFLVIARSYGSKAEGVELCDFSASLGRERFGVDIKTGTLRSVGYRKHRFDIITMFELIEHLPDPSAFLREIHRILKNGGLICISTPNYHCHLKYGSRWLGFTKSFEHIFFFDDGSLGALLRKPGFEVIHSETIERISPLGRGIMFNERRKRKFLALRNGLSRRPLLFRLGRYFWKVCTNAQIRRNERTGFGHNLLVLARKTPASS